MGGSVSREVSITDDKSGNMPASFSWSGTFPRGISMEGSLSTKLTKFKKFEVTPKKKAPETNDALVEENGEVTETTDKEFIETLLLNVLDDALEGIGNKGMSKSSTLPANFKGLGLNRNQSFGKRIRKSIRKLVVKTPKKNKGGRQGSSEDIVEALLVEVLTDVTGGLEESIENLEKAELSETVIEEVILEENEQMDEASDVVNDMNTSKSSTLPANFKGLGSTPNQSFGKRMRQTIRKFVTPKKKSGIVGQKESIELVETLLSEIIAEALGEEVTEDTKETPSKESGETGLANDTKSLQIGDEVAEEKKGEEIIKKEDSSGSPERKSE